MKGSHVKVNRPPGESKNGSQIVKSLILYIKSLVLGQKSTVVTLEHKGRTR